MEFQHLVSITSVPITHSSRAARPANDLISTNRSQSKERPTQHWATEEGERQSRRNALRHGLTAETVVDGLEDSEDYRAFEAAVIADYDAQAAVERELVLRLDSLLWRLRRIIAMRRVSRAAPRSRTGIRFEHGIATSCLRSAADGKDEDSRYDALPFSARDLEAFLIWRAESPKGCAAPDETAIAATVKGLTIQGYENACAYCGRRPSRQSAPSSPASPRPARRAGCGCGSAIPASRASHPN
jgi:hypothetical protein